MFLKPKETLHNHPFFKSFSLSVLASLTTATLLIVAYTLPWFAWLTWIAFVPFILGIQGRKRLQVYALTTLWTLIYFSFLTYLTNIWNLFPIAIPFVLFIVFTILISEIQLLSKRFSNWGWVTPALLWTILLLVTNLFAPIIVEALAAIASIIPISQPLFHLIAGTYGGYILILAVLLMNAYIAHALVRFGKRQKYVPVAVICGALLGLLGSPITDLPTSTPQAQGMDTKILREMAESIPKKHPSIRSVVVVRHGYTVLEKYFQGCTPYSLNLICSDTKSITGALVGIAINNGNIKSVNEKIVDFFPEYITPKTDPSINNITIKHLLTMESGLYSDELSSARQYSKFLHSKDWIKFVLQDTKMSFEPGKGYQYNSTATHLLSGIINRTSKTKKSQFADRNLFGPLGIYRRIWRSDPQDNNFGGASMFLKSRDMAKFGYLYLKNGSWNGKQIIPSQWVNDSTQVHNEGGLPHGEQYGYLFWVNSVGGHASYYAGGFGGQYIYVIPDLDLVIAITANTDIHRTDGAHIVSNYIVPATLE